MTTYVDALRGLDSHERGILLRWAPDLDVPRTLALAPAVLEKVGATDERAQIRVA